MRKLLSIAVTILALTLLAYLMLDPLIRQMLYPAPPIPVPSPPSPLQEVVLDLPGDEQAIGWSREQSIPASPAVLFFHGNGENLETVRLSGLFDQLSTLGVHVLAVDYPGYGRSTGEPSEASLSAAGEAGLAWLARRHPESKKVVLGWSLGAAVAIKTAAGDSSEVGESRPRRVDGLVLMSAWSDLASLAAMHYPGWLVGLGLKDKYDSAAAAADVHAPVLMIHGAADQLIPMAQGRRLHQAFESSSREEGKTCRFVEVPGVGHNDLLARPVVWQELGAFLQSLDARRAD